MPNIASYYVYFLIDPRDNKIFYVGKGKGKRIHRHVFDAKNKKVANVPKHLKIMEIIKSNNVVIEQIYAMFWEEKYAYGLEKLLIKELKESGLTNIANGVAENSKELIAEKNRQQAKDLLMRLKPYWLWIKCATQEQINFVKKYGNNNVEQGYEKLSMEVASQLFEVAAL